MSQRYQRVFHVRRQGSGEFKVKIIYALSFHACRGIQRLFVLNNSLNPHGLFILALFLYIIQKIMNWVLAEMTMQEEFKKNGFVYLKNVFSTAEITQLEADLKEAAATKSGDDVLDKGNLKFHALLMHRSEKIRAFISQAKIIDLLSPLAGPDIWVRWDQAVEKQPGAGVFPWHQDNQYSYLKDQHYQFWISMTSMTDGR